MFDFILIFFFYYFIFCSNSFLLMVTSKSCYENNLLKCRLFCHTDWAVQAYNFLYTYSNISGKACNNISNIERVAKLIVFFSLLSQRKIEDKIWRKLTAHKQKTSQIKKFKNRHFSSFISLLMNYSFLIMTIAIEFILWYWIK